MADFSVPFVNQVDAQRDAQDQQRQQAQFLQMGQMALMQRRRKEADDDRDFRVMVGMAGNQDLPDELRLEAINKAGEKIGLQGTVTLDGLRPMSSMLKEMVKTHAAGGDMSVFRPQIDMISAKPNLISPAQLPEFAQVADAANQAQAEQVINEANPRPELVQNAMDRMKLREPDLAEMRGQVDKWQGNANSPSALVQQESFDNLTKLRDLEGEQARDNAAVQADTARQERNVQIAKLSRSDPKTMAHIQQYGLQKSNLLPADDNFFKMQLHELQSMDTADLTDTQMRKMDSLSRLVYGKSFTQGMAGQNAQLLTFQAKQAKAEAANLGKMRDVDQAAQDQVNQLQPALDDILKRANSPTVSEEEFRKAQTDAAAQSQAIGNAKLQAVQAAAPHVQALAEERKTLSESLTSQRRQAASSVGAQREKYLAEADKTQRLMEAKDAQGKLLTEFQPMEGAEHEWIRRVNVEHAARLEDILKDQGLDATKRTALMAQLETARQTVITEETFLDKWKTGRQQALTTIAKTQLQLEREAAVLDDKKTAAMAHVEEQEATNLLARAMVSDMGNGKTMMEALQANKDSFGKAKAHDAVKIVTDAMKADVPTATAYAQDYFVAKLATTAKGAITPQTYAKYAEEATAFTKRKYPGIAVAADDIMKAIPRDAGVKIELTQEKAESKTVGEGFGKEYLAMQEAGRLASGKIAKLDQMESLLSGAGTGRLAPAMTEIQAWGQALGFRVDPNLGPKQASEALANEIALELRSTGNGAGMPGALSDQDREFLRSMTPGLSKTPEGNKLIIETRRKLAQRDQEVAKIAREYRKQHGQADEGLLDQVQTYADTHPLFKGQAAPAAAAPSGKGSVPQINSDAEYNALPPGSIFMDPQGQKRKKP